MQTLLIIALIAIMGMVVYSLVRGIIAFLQSTKMDLEEEDTGKASEMQLLQNKMMFARIKWQALAVVVVVVLLAAAGGRG